MGQKSNPNSFNRANYLSQYYSGFNNPFEYFHLFKDVFFLKKYIIKLFERNQCFIQECEILVNSRTGHLLIYISFLAFKPNIFKLPRSKQTSRFGFTISSQRFKQKQQNLMFNSVLMRLKRNLAEYGYNLPTFFILKNLTASCKKNLGKHKKDLMKEFGRFRKMPFFRAGLLVFLLLNSTKGKSFVLMSFVGRFLKLLHRSKKINFFFQFIRELFKQLKGFRGVKLKIKGRFRKASRSKSRVFQSGSLPLQTVSSQISYSAGHIFTSYGVFGVKVWIHY